MWFRRRWEVLAYLLPGDPVWVAAAETSRAATAWPLGHQQSARAGPAPMRIRAAPGAVGQVGLAVVLGCAVALAVAVVLTAVDAVAARTSPAGPAEGGVVILFLAAALVYGAITGALVGAAGAVLLPGRGRVPPRQRVAFVVVACVIAAAAIGGIAVLIDLTGLVLAVPVVLVVPALVVYLRRYAPRAPPRAARSQRRGGCRRSRRPRRADACVFRMDL